MSNEFVLHVKSTIDKTMMDLVTSLQGTYPTLQGVEVDDLNATDEVMKSTAPALLWQFLGLTPAPRDPLYRVEFLVGVKTVSDAANYVLTKIMMEVRKSFEVEATIDVADYSGVSAVLNKGYLFVTDNAMVPQQYDQMSGIRYFAIVARAVRMF